jgi:predicted alpha/beta-fold hydrolase
VRPLALRFERVELADGDFVDLAWAPATGTRVVIVLHGLEGSHRSGYARAILGSLGDAGYVGVLLQFRGCSGELNRLDRAYHSGDTGDLAAIAAHIEARTGAPPFAAIGYSLGGNVLLKWLGELGSDARLTTAVAVSVPFDLAACADRLDEGFSCLYQYRLVRSMQRKYLAKFAVRQAPLDISDVRALNTFWKFDDAVTAPLHGFSDANEYYGLSSSRQFLKRVTLPTLILQARDDPFVPQRAIPTAAELGAQTTLELTRAGGHVGFLGRVNKGRLSYWLEPRIIEHLREIERSLGE